MDHARHTTTDGGSADDALRRLEARLERASSAAERLFAEAASEAAAAATRVGGRAAAGSRAGARGEAAGGIPPQGWQTHEDGAQTRSGGDLELLVAMWASVRDLVPPELRRRLAEAVQELLLAVRMLVEWYLERLDRHRDTPVEVQDIPVT